MSRIGYTPAYDAEKSHPYHRGIEDRHRLRQIDADHRWKIVRLSAAQSRRAGTNRRRRRRKPCSESSSRKILVTEMRLARVESFLYLDFRNHSEIGMRDFLVYRLRISDQRHFTVKNVPAS